MVNQGVQIWTVPLTGIYNFSVAGARGGWCNGDGLYSGG
jgi:hypothetical protein